MLGIDISHHNDWPFDNDTATAYKASDFVIVKATEGLSYKYVDYFAPAMRKVLSDGKLAGAYHYSEGKNPEAEADYFLSVIKPFLGKIIVALDWEDDFNKAWNTDKTWCSRFVARIKEKTGLTCFLYTGADGLDDCANIANKVPLWFAGYPIKNYDSWVVPNWPSRYNIAPWKSYKIWQFTDRGCDRNVTAMTASEWKSFCKTKTDAPELKGYSGEYPSLPSRGYYTLGDGYKQNPGLVMDIKKLQKLVNWINGGNIKVDGAYGPNTIAAVKLAQTNLKVYPDGLFGSKTLFAAKAYKKC